MAGVSSCQLIRYKPDSRGQGGLIEKLGGWSKFWSQQMPSTVRALHAWQDLNENKWVAAGMSTQPSTTKGPLNVVPCVTNSAGLTQGNQVFDITPVYQTSNGTATLSVTGGSATVSVNDSSVSNVLGGSTVYFTEQVAIGGIVLYGSYKVDAPTGVSSYQFTALTDLGAPQPALTSSTTPAVPLSSNADCSAPLIRSALASLVASMVPLTLIRAVCFASIRFSPPSQSTTSTSTATR